jgi:hypothetical protein
MCSQLRQQLVGGLLQLVSVFAARARVLRLGSFYQLLTTTLHSHAHILRLVVEEVHECFARSVQGIGSVGVSAHRVQQHTHTYHNTGISKPCRSEPKRKIRTSCFTDFATIFSALVRMVKQIFTARDSNRWPVNVVSQELDRVDAVRCGNLRSDGILHAARLGLRLRLKLGVSHRLCAWFCLSRRDTRR